MKKKNLIIIIFLMTIAITGLVLFIKFDKNSQNYSQSEEGFTEQELNDMEYVDNKLEQLLKDEKYQKLDLDNKANEVKKLLKQLKKDKYIKNYNYETNSYMFSFEYKCGVYGGVMIKDFDPMLN